MMKTLNTLLLLVSLVVNKNADSPSPASRITFSIDNAAIAVEGSLEVVAAEISFDPDALDRSSIMATADPSTIRTGIAMRDKHLKRSDYFDADHYPVIRLRSRAFRKVKKNTFTGMFDLTIKDITRQVMITFTVVHEHGSIRYRGAFEVSRLDFGLGESSATLDEKVKVTLEARENV